MAVIVTGVSQVRALTIQPMPKNLCAHGAFLVVDRKYWAHASNTVYTTLLPNDGVFTPNYDQAANMAEALLKFRLITDVQAAALRKEAEDRSHHRDVRTEVYALRRAASVVGLILTPTQQLALSTFDR